MSNYATRAYAQVGVHTAVETASPHKLISMLYEGLLKHLRIARAHMANGEVGPKASALSKAMSILDQGLRMSLDPEAGGEIATKLHALYDYCERRLLHANLHNDLAALDEVMQLIEPLRSAWLQINPDAQRTLQGAAR
jgi:flagellar protein FliS